MQMYKVSFVTQIEPKEVCNIISNISEYFVYDMDCALAVNQAMKIHTEFMIAQYDKIVSKYEIITIEARLIFEEVF